MIMNFLGEFKYSLNFLKTKLINVFKKLNYLVILDVIILTFCAVLLLNLDVLNIIFNSFLLNLLVSNNVLLLVLFFLVSISNLLINKLYYKSNKFNNENWNVLYLQFLYVLYLRLNLKSNLIYLYYNILFIFKTIFVNNSYILSNLNFRTLYWYPIFKRHSIFGYYRIARQNWVELKSEEVNYLKY